MRLIALTRRFTSRFWRETEGSVLVEGALSVLLLTVWMVMSFQFYDAYRTKANNEAAADTISDLISREKQTIGPKYIEEMRQVFTFLTSGEGRSWMRVTGVNYSATNNRYEVLWSAATDGRQAYTTAALQSEAGRLPVLEASASKMLILVETSVNYDPLAGKRADGSGFGLGSNIWMSSFIAREPRDMALKWDPAF